MKLIGRIVWYTMNPLKHRGRCGHYQGKVTNAGYTKKGLKFLTITRASYNDGRFGWDGQKMKIFPEEVLGVLWRGKLRKFDQANFMQPI